MTIYYVDSTDGGSLNQGTQAEPWSKLRDITGLVAGDIVRVSHLHSVADDLGSSHTFGDSQDSSDPIIIYSCNFSDSYSYLAGASDEGIVGTGTASSSYDGQNVVIMGITMRGQAYMNLGSSTYMTVIDGKVGTCRTSNYGYIQGGISQATFNLIDTDVQFEAVLAKFFIDSGDSMIMRWKGGSLLAGTNTQTDLIGFHNNCVSGDLLFEGVDLSTGDFTNLVDISSVASAGGLKRVRLVGCKMPATYTLVNATSDFLPDPGWRVELFGCDDGTITDPTFSYRHEQAAGFSDTVLTHRRSGGAGDGHQANEYSQVITARGNGTKKGFPTAAVYVDLEAYIETTGSKEIKVHFAHTGGGSGTGGLYQDDEVFIDVFGPAETTATALFAHKRTVPDYLVTATDLTEETGETWIDDGSPTITKKQSVSTTYTTAIEGRVKVRIYFAPENTVNESIYVCPRIQVI